MHAIRSVSGSFKVGKPNVLQVSPAPTSIFAEHADAFFPALVSVVLPPAGPTETDIKYGAFHYLLRDMALVFLGWKKLFQRGPGTLMMSASMAAVLSVSVR